MAFIPFVNSVELTINGVLSGQEVVMTLGFENGAGITITGMENLAAAVASWFITDILPALSNEFVLQFLKVTDLTTVSSPAIEYSFGMPAVGGAVEASAPNNAALVTSFLTESRGRSYRGRNYLPGIPHGDMLNSVEWDHTFASNIASDYALLAAALPTGWEHVILSRFTGGAPRSTGVTTPVTQYRTTPIIDSQRRRLEGRGA